jgi:ribonuclease D
VELGSFCKNVGAVEDGRSGLADIVENVLKVHLSKDPTIRESPLDAEKLTNDQILYACLDSYMGLRD